MSSALYQIISVWLDPRDALSQDQNQGDCTTVGRIYIYIYIYGNIFIH